MERPTDPVTASYERHLRLAELSAFTILNYRISIDKVSRFIDAPAHTATTLQLEELFASWIDRYAATTRQQTWINLRVFYLWCMRRGFIASNPLTEIPKSSVQDVPPRVLTLEQLRLLVAACKGRTLADRRDEAIIRCMSEPGGMRATEVRLIKNVDIDWVNQLVEVSGKTGSRLISLSDRTMDAMERYVAIRDRHRYAQSPWFWLTGRRDSKGMSRRALGEMVDRRAHKAGIGHVEPKEIRHTAADRALSAGMNVADMNRTFGWAASSTMAGEVYGRARATQRALDAARATGMGDKI
ncbi:tyrosine-type recombinase/integrase [Actinoplanes sp. L3-i22]|uniref:tyrosine-type recombinase/integrase n=1 Tax=Actinoplanes sp. L3-i22 TaxID=2836373 RepID=UPI001C782190|nr:tyrosine-type recombinase/integrase [Actinoplanes sp. L3-i22]BCY09050.1 tyrosine recombinase XerD [Actinoplanes sp. L3-i22]